MIRLTKHAQEAIDVRNITLAWIEATVNSPDFVEVDPRHPERTRSLEGGPRIRRPNAAGCASGGWR
jgi:Domain of unknown function (DUF4258)